MKIWHELTQPGKARRLNKFIKLCQLNKLEINQYEPYMKRLTEDYYYAASKEESTLDEIRNSIIREKLGFDEKGNFSVWTANMSKNILKYLY